MVVNWDIQCFLHITSLHMEARELSILYNQKHKCSMLPCSTQKKTTRGTFEVSSVSKGVAWNEADGLCSQRPEFLSVSHWIKAQYPVLGCLLNEETAQNKLFVITFETEWNCYTLKSHWKVSRGGHWKLHWDTTANAHPRVSGQSTLQRVDFHLHWHYSCHHRLSGSLTSLWCHV